MTDGGYSVGKRNKGRILTQTHNKFMIRDSELQRVLNSTELRAFNDIINKIRDFDRKENERMTAE